MHIFSEIKRNLKKKQYIYIDILFIKNCNKEIVL